MDIVLEGVETFGHLLDPGREGIARRFVEHVHAPVRVHADRFAEGAAEQSRDRESGDLAGNIPKGDVDTADGWDARHVGVHERGHVLKVDLDRKSVLADEQRLHSRDACARHGPGHAGFAIPDDAGVGFDLDETVAGDAVDLHRFDIGYFDLVPLRGNQRVESREYTGDGQGYGEAEHFTTSEGRHDNRLQQGSISLTIGHPNPLFRTTAKY